MSQVKVTDQRIYLPGLNGLRAIAAITVMFSHMFEPSFANWGIIPIKLPLFTGGVTLFFVISGFLITYLLLQEYSKAETIQVKKFYVRRILRIWPIYYAYILISIIVLYFAGLSDEILNARLWFYVFFTANIPFLSSSGIWILVHYWSIGVEEQFYLFWPLVVKFSKKKLLRTVMTIMILWLCFKYGSWIIFSNKSLVYRFFAVTSFQSMMIGATGAILFFRKNKLFLRLLTKNYVQILTWCFFLGNGFFIEYIPAIIRNEIVAAFSLILIIGQVENKLKYLSLENKIFDFIGKISYGIYVIHPLVIFLGSILWRRYVSGVNLTSEYFIIYIGVCCATVLLAWLSYNYFERPFLRIKDKYAVVKSGNSSNSKM